MNLDRITKNDILMLDFVIENGEVSYSEFRDYVVNDDPSKRIYAKQTFSKRINSFAKAGLLKKKLDDETGRPKYYVPNEAKPELEKAKLREKSKDIIDEIDDTDKLRRLRRELQRTKRQLRINELEGMPLPSRAVYEKLLGMQFTMQQVNLIFKQATNVASGFFWDKFSPDLLIIKVVSFEDYEREYMLHPGWLRLYVNRNKRGVVDQRKPVIIGIYKELLQLYDEEFEDELLGIKEKFRLNDNDWKILGPNIREMRGMFGAQTAYIENFLGPYVNSKTPEGRARLIEIRKKQFGKEKGEKMAREEIEFCRRLRREAGIEN